MHTNPLILSNNFLAPNLQEMALWERHTQKLHPKEPSFSSSLLDAIYRSIDETHKPQHHFTRRNQPEDDVESLRRAIMIEKWIETYTPHPTGHHPSNSSASSTDSSIFSSETDSSPKSSLKHKIIVQAQTQPPPAKRDGRFTKTKTRAQKLYGDLKKVKEPISPGGKISNFFNSIFSPRNLKTTQCLDEWSSATSMRKSKSMKDTTTSCSLTSRSCLSKNASSRGSKSKRSVRFCPVNVIVGGDKNIYQDDFSMKKNVDSFRLFEAKNMRKYEVRDYYHSDKDLDAMSCASSDLFELENIGRLEIGGFEEELPVYETTSLEMNQSIAKGGLVM